MSLHHALKDNDILAEIFSHLSLISSPLDIKQRHPLYWAPLQNTQQLGLDQKYGIDGGDSTVTNRHALRNAALTCKSFSELAVTYLWEAPRGGLYTLFGLFSGFTETKSTRYRMSVQGMNEFSISNYHIEGDITDEEWETFLRCASRVRELAVHRLYDRTNYPWSISLSVFEAIVNRSAGRLLFSRLRALMWQRSAADHSSKGAILDQFLPLLSSPSLSIVMIMSYPDWKEPGLAEGSSIFLPPPREGTPQDIETLVGSSHNLEHVVVHMSFESGTLTRLAQCRRLRTFVAHWVDTPTLESIGGLSHLRSIRTSIGSTAPESLLRADIISPLPTSLPMPCILDSTLFPALRELQLDKSDAMHAKMLILSISSRLLTSISISLREDDPYLVHQLFTALPTVAGLLRSLEIALPHSGIPGTYHPSNKVVIFEVVGAPLLQLHSLEYFQFDMDDRSLSLTDGDVQRIASSWPNITCLYIAATGARYRFAHAGHVELQVDPAVDRPSIHTLVALALQYPKLVSCVLPTGAITDADLLKLEQDAASVPSQGRVLQLAISGPLVPAWQPGAEQQQATPVHDPERLTNVLCRLFPRMDRRRVQAGRCDSVEVLQEEAERRFTFGDVLDCDGSAAQNANLAMLLQLLDFADGSSAAAEIVLPWGVY